MLRRSARITPQWSSALLSWYLRRVASRWSARSGSLSNCRASTHGCLQVRSTKRRRTKTGTACSRSASTRWTTRQRCTSTPPFPCRTVSCSCSVLVTRREPTCSRRCPPPPARRASKPLCSHRLRSTNSPMWTATWLANRFSTMCMDRMTRATSRTRKPTRSPSTSMWKIHSWLRFPSVTWWRTELLFFELTSIPMEVELT
mmetsp:Transcript_47798/g.120348  ORF Transcript_47798/g.120348 Transcript_47798/m.120348 type:complete len:201 (+) Transcript_47798:378-980(+)